MMHAGRLELSRRQWLRFAAASTACGLTSLGACDRQLRAAEPDRALVAITLDLEMSRNFPVWEATHWDYEKGNLDEPTKRYAVEAARRVKRAGGLLHFFLVGRALEQPDVDWLKEIAAAGHPIGNHTYDHINVTAQRNEDLQFRFQRSPWLLRGLSTAEAIRENIQLANIAMHSRLGIRSTGFRTPGGFVTGLRDQPEVRTLLRGLGFDWVSSLYPRHPNTAAGEEPSAEVLSAIVAAQAEAQPFVYPDGLVEVPMSPISDVGAFRNGRWQLDWFLRAIRQSVEKAIDERRVFDFLAHPSCLGVVDPQFRTIDLICDLVAKAGERAAIVDLGTIAARTQMRR